MTKHDENWLLLKGWRKEKGFKVIHEILNEDWEYSFWREEDRADVITENVIWYQDPNNEEFATDDLNEAIERQEEYDDDEETEAQTQASPKK